MDSMNKDQLHAIWIERFKLFADRVAKAYYKDEKVEGRVLQLEDLDECIDQDILSEDGRQVVLPMKTIGIVSLSKGAPYVFSHLSAASIAHLESPFTIDGEAVKPSPYIFSLADLMISLHPRNMYTGVFKTTLAGRGMFNTDPFQMERIEVVHMMGAGLGIQLVEQVRDIINPLSTDADLLDATAGMYIEFYSR